MMGGIAASTAAMAVSTAAMTTGVVALSSTTTKPVKPITAKAMSTPATMMQGSLFRMKMPSVFPSQVGSIERVPVAAGGATRPTLCYIYASAVLVSR